jgi:hypothetical protein
MLFNIFDWYWIVAGSTAQVYSSKLRNYVQAADATYQAWLAAGGIPTKIDTEASLGEVFVPYSLRPIPPGVLQGYDDAIVKELDTMKIMKAFSLTMLDEINLLRAEHSLAARTPAQLRAAVRAKLAV